MLEIKKIAVIGAGTMGGGIVQVAARTGLKVNMVDVDNTMLQKGFTVIKNNLRAAKDKGKITEQQETSTIASIHCTLDMKEAAGDVDMVIEAVPEDLNLKQQIFKKLDEISDKRTILASCTSGISITAIASVTKRRDKVIGMHFTNPVPLMKGVAVITGLETSDETLNIAKNVLSAMGKEYWVTKDFPGFSGTRIISMYINEAFYVLQDGVATPEDIDKELKMVLGHPMGPLELADMVGLDVILKSSEYLFAERGEKYRPSPLLKQLVAAGHLGKKTGRGVYKYK